MVTLTLPHEAEEGRAEELLDLAWRRLRRHARRGHWSRSSLAAREWTPGRDGRGHPHLHVVVVASYVAYADVRASWRDAALAVGAQEPRGRGIDVQVRSGAAAADAAARYMAKEAASAAADYVGGGKSKKVLLLGVRDWARLAAWMAGRRLYLASRGWWRAAPPTCSCCDQRFAWATPKDSLWLAVGGDAARWSGRAPRIEYDPLSGWCRVGSDVDDAGESSSVDSIHGTMSMVPGAYPMGDSRLTEPISKKDLDMDIMREDAHLARVKWKRSVTG